MKSIRPLAAVSSAPYQRQNVGEPGRRSTATSKIAPVAQRTSFVSACGAAWKCIPRSVSRRAL
jgi:hypothetical protein